MASFELDTWAWRTNTQLKKLQQLFYDEDVILSMHEIVGEAINPFVPMKTGALRESMTPTLEGVMWGGDDSEASEYAHYQHEGIVYGPNLPGWAYGEAGWRSKGTKYPTGRRLGISGFASLRPRWVLEGSYRKATIDDPDIGWTFGYTTPNTMSNWEYAFNYDVKRKAQIEITRMLTAKCKEEGII